MTSFLEADGTTPSLANIGPADHNLKAWAFDPAALSAGSALTAGAPVTMKMRLLKDDTITNLLCYVSTAGTSLTSGQNFGALYKSDGTLLAQTTDATTAFGTTGLKTLPLTAPQAVSKGVCYAMFWFNGTGTAVALLRGTAFAAALANVGLSGLGTRFGQTSGGVTTTAPAGPIAPGGLSTTFWAAAS